MNKSPKKLLTIASAGMSVAGVIFLCLMLLGYGREWTVFAVLGCVFISTLFQVVSMHMK